MTCFTIARRHTLRFLSLVGAVFTLLALESIARGEPPPTSANRFLFIFDVSAGMKTLEEPLRDTAFDLLYSGLRGHMTNGDSYGAWLVGDRNDTSAGVEVWRQKFAVELASRLALRVKERGCKGKSAMEAAIADATRVVKAAGDLTVVLVTSGTTPIKGTPFDAEINAAMSSMLPEMTRAKAPMNTVLIAQDGNFVAWAINGPEYLINYPITVPKKKIVPTPTPPAVAAIPPANPKTDAPNAQSTVTSKPAPAPARIASNPIIITRETVDRERQVTRALAATMDGAAPTLAIIPSAAPTNVLATNASVTNVAAIKPATPPPHEETISPTNKAISAAIAPPAEDPIKLNSRPAAETIISNAAAVPIKETSFVAPATPAKSSINAALWMLLGAVGGAGLLYVAWRVWGNPDEEKSLISTAIALSHEGRENVK